MRDWLDSSSFQSIGTHFREELSTDREVVIILETEDDRIYRLPWHCWSAIAARQRTEITFSLNTYSVSN